MFYKGKNILVAGAAGLVGQTLIRKLLDEGAHVRATWHTRPLELTHKNLEVLQVDLTKPEDISRIFNEMDIAFLAAAQVRGAKQITEDPSSIILYNLKLHADLLDQAWRQKLDRCALISSSYVYPNTGKPNVEAEGFQGDPLVPTCYGLGWMCRYLETLCAHFQMTSKTKYAVIRPTAYYGPYDNFNLDECHVVPALIVKAENKMNPFEVWGTPSVMRSFTYVDDLVDGLMLTLERHATAEALNICTPEASSVEQLVQSVLEVVGFNPDVIWNQDKPSTVPYKVSSPALAKKVLGWEAKTSLKEGLQKTIQWYRKSAANVK